MTLYEIADITSEMTDEKKKEEFLNDYYKCYSEWLDRELELAKAKWREEGKLK